jgi:hypothetical protein
VRSRSARLSPVFAVLLLLPSAALGHADPSQAGGSPSPAATEASPSALPGLEPGASPARAARLSPDAPLEWLQLRPAEGPAAREDHTWTVDATGASAWLFGGRDGSVAYDDLWRYDLAAGTWSEMALDGRRPKARFGHAAAWVPEVGLVVFAGQLGTDFFDDLWAYDPGADAWRKLPAKGAKPAPRYGTCAGLGADGRLWISHGFTFRGRFDDTRAYDFESGTWSDETPAGRRPSERCLHDCFWSLDGRLVLYGGQDDGAVSLGDAWALRPDEGWSKVPAPPADARRLYGLALDAESAWIFGGAARDNSLHQDLWRVDRDTLEWHAVDPGGALPAGRSASTLAFDAAGAGRLLLFGGDARNARKADLWQLAPISPAGT